MRRTFHIPLSIIELEPNNYHLLCRARVNGHPIRLIIDTGASHTCLDTSFITSIRQDVEITEYNGLRVGISSHDFECHIATIKQFKINRFELNHYQVILLDLTHINQAYMIVKLPAVQGILGSDFLRYYGAVINYNTRTLTIHIPKNL